MGNLTMFGKTYDTVGSTDSNLLLRTKGDVKILWGNKFIDVIKKGKIASSDSNIFKVVESTDDMDENGLYVINVESSDESEESSCEVWVRIDGENYQVNTTGNTCVSFVLEQTDVTIDLKTLALKNIGFIYDTYEDVQTAQLTKGIVYALDTKKLYVISDGSISEYTTATTTTTESSTDESDDETELGNIVLKKDAYLMTFNALDNLHGVFINQFNNTGHIYSDNINSKNTVTDVLQVSDSSTLGETTIMEANIGTLNVGTIKGDVPTGTIIMWYPIKTYTSGTGDKFAFTSDASLVLDASNNKLTCGSGTIYFIVGRSNDTSCKLLLDSYLPIHYYTTETKEIYSDLLLDDDGNPVYDSSGEPVYDTVTYEYIEVSHDVEEGTLYMNLDKTLISSDPGGVANEYGWFYILSKPITITDSAYIKNDIDYNVDVYSQYSIPKGWAICNGENGTPDLTDCFIKSSSYTIDTSTTDDDIVLSSSGDTTYKNDCGKDTIELDIDKKLNQYTLVFLMKL